MTPLLAMLLLLLSACADNRLAGATPDEAFEIVQESICDFAFRCSGVEPDQALCEAAFDDRSAYQAPISDEDLELIDSCLDAIDGLSCNNIESIANRTDCHAVARYIDIATKD